MRILFQNARARTAFFVILIFCFGAIFAPFLATHDPFVGGKDALLPPSLSHVMGSDHLGRDVWSQLIYGARVSLLVGILAALSASIVGLLIGCVAGYFGGVVDAILMRISEFFQTLPRFVLATIIVAVFGSGLIKVIFVIALLGWMQTARVVRVQVLSLRRAEFIQASIQSGATAWQIVRQHIVPNVLSSVVVTGSLDVASAILLEGGLGFFGLSDPNLISWGSMLNQAQPYLRQAWWMAFFPGAAISCVVLAFNIFGDGLNEALNPFLRKLRAG
jgi:peptide/nickel transport system permease protein